MESIRKKVLNELFLAPSVVLPIVAGASAWLVSWGFGGIPPLNLAGLVGVLGGLGWMATRIIFQVDAIAERTMRHAEAVQAREEEAKVEAIAARIRHDSDPRVADYLTLLREHRREFERLAQNPEIQDRTLQVRSQFHQLFWGSLVQLDESYTLTELAKKLRSQQRAEILAKREAILDDVKATTERLAVVIDHFRQLNIREQNTDLGTLRDELDLSLKIARRAEERVRALESEVNNERPYQE